MALKDWKNLPDTSTPITADNLKNDGEYLKEYIDNSNTYSTDEVRIGTWIDGKPLYRKVIQSTLPETTADGIDATSDVSHNVSNIRRGTGTFIANAFFISAGYNSIPVPHVTSNINIRVGLQGTTNIRIHNNNTNCNGLTVFIILHYTKTTD